MKRVIACFIYLIWTLNGWARSLPPLPEGFAQSFMMTVAEDGKETTDNFEIWDVSCSFKGRQPACSILAASFITSDETRVYLWQHVVTKALEVQPGIFRIEMNGRMNP
jgi:hypothetical protein